MFFAKKCRKTKQEKRKRKSQKKIVDLYTGQELVSRDKNLILKS